MNDAIDKIFEQKDTTDIEAIKEEVKKLMMSSMTKKPRGRAVKSENKVEQVAQSSPVVEDVVQSSPVVEDVKEKVVVFPVPTMENVVKLNEPVQTPCPSPASVEVEETKEVSPSVVAVPVKKPRQRAVKTKKDESVNDVSLPDEPTSVNEVSESPSEVKQVVQRKPRQRAPNKKTSVIDVPSEQVSDDVDNPPTEEQPKPVRVPRTRKVKAPIEPERRCSTVHRIGNMTKQCAEEKVNDEPYCQKCLTKINKSQGKIPKGKGKIGGPAPTNLLSNYMDEKQIKELVEGEKNNVVIEAIGNGYYRGKTDSFCYRTMGPPSHLVCIGKLNEATKSVEPLSDEEMRFQIETRRISCTYDEKVSEQYIEALIMREKNKIVAVKATVIEDVFSKFKLPDINTSVHTMKPGDDVSDEEDLSEEE
jgi:hypothetical protein